MTLRNITADLLEKDSRRSHMSTGIRLLAPLSVQLNEAATLAELLERIYPLLAEEASASWMLLWRVREAGFELLSAAGDLPLALMDISRAVTFDQPSFARQAMRSRQAVFVGSYAMSQAEANPAVAAFFAGASAYFPLLNRDRSCWGVLALASSESRQEWPELTQVVLEIAARMVGTTLILQLEVEERQRREQHLEQQEAALEQRMEERTREVLQLKATAEVRATEAEYLAELTRELDQHDDPREVMQSVVLRLRKLLPTSYVGVGVGTLESGLDPWAMAGDLPESVEDMRCRRITSEEGGLIWAALTGGRAIYVDDYGALPDTANRHPAMLRAGLTSCAHVPLPVGNLEAGILSVLTFGASLPWTAAQKRLLEATVHTLALAVQRASRLQTLQQEKDYADVLRRVSELTESEKPIEEVGYLAVEAISRVADVDWAGFSAVEGDMVSARSIWGAGNIPPALDASIKSGLPRGIGVIWSVIERGEATFVDDYRALSGGVPSCVEQGVRSVAFIPVVTGGLSPMVFTVMRMSRARPWTQRDRGLVLAAARSIGLTLARRRSLQLLRNEADLDGLTRVHNRGFFDRALPGIQEGDALALLDLDHFKRINDQLGHRAGDRELQAFADCLRQVSRQNDLVARYGGEEFVAVLPRGGADGARLFLERLRTTWRARNPITTFSAGISAFKGSPAITLERADSALYRAKQNGRDRYEVAEDRQSSSSLLVVEDERDVRLLLTELLEMAGHEVVAVPDGLAALTVLRTRTTFDAIMLDLMMPIMSGSQFVTELRQNLSLARIPIIVLSALADTEPRARVLGAAAWVQKPFHPEALEAAVNKVLKGST